MNWHILPTNDIEEHTEKDSCKCNPRIELISRSKLIIHNSFDGREQIEEDIKKYIDEFLLRG